MAGDPLELQARLLAVYDEFAACDTSALTKEDLLALGDGFEQLSRRLPTRWHDLLTQLKTQTGPKALGAKTWNEVLRTRWRLSTAEAGRRLAEAAELASRPMVSGPPLEPALPAIAAAQALGAITPEMVQVLRDTMRKIPRHVDAVTRSQVEVELVRVAASSGDKELREAAALRLLLLDQDGPEPDVEERDRKRQAVLGEQGSDLMTEFRATLTPELAALFEVLFAKFAAPGMCNPADSEPCTSGTPSQAQIDADDRSLSQRQHDALVVVGRIALQTDLGTLNGLPVSILIRTTLQDLESRGIAITGDGRLLTMDDLDRLGGHAAYHLCVFDKATGSALNHFRAKRVATAAQRIMLISKYGGCTKPGCTVGAYGVQMHHAVADWAHDGLTNIDDLAPACGGDNNLVGPGGYTTVINDQCECEWIPPEHLDTGQTRVNILHRPELLLTPTDEDDETAAPTSEPETPAPEPNGDTTPEPTLDPEYLFGPPDDAPTPSRPRRWTDEEHAAVNRRYPNGPFADYPDESDDTLGADDPLFAEWDIDTETCPPFIRFRGSYLTSNGEADVRAGRRLHRLINQYCTPSIRRDIVGPAPPADTAV